MNILEFNQVITLTNLKSINKNIMKDRKWVKV
jgi:hypothetical protein